MHGSSLFQNFKTNDKKETEGVLVTYSPNADKTVPGFRVSRMGKTNQRYRKALEKAARPVRRQIELGTLANEKSDAITMRVFCETVLLTWENIQDAEGKEISFSVDNAIKLFEALPDLYDDLSQQASTAATFRDEETENDAKN